MKISVIVPHLAGEIFLQDCMASLEAQPEIEIITKEDDKNSPKGVAAMRNLGLEAASGDFVLFLDSDDYIGNDAVTALKEAAEREPDRLHLLKKKKTWYKRDTELAEAGRSGREDEAEDHEEATDAKAEDHEEAPDADAKAGKPDEITAAADKDADERYFRDSVLGVLIPSKYVKGSNALRFDEKLKFYSDIPFMAGLLARFKMTQPFNVVDALYYKRSRNDAIRYPALSQLKDNNRNAEFAQACRMAEEVIAREGGASAAVTSGNTATSPDTPGSPSDESGQNVLNGLYAFICGHISRLLTKGKHPEGGEWSVEQLGTIASVMKTVPDEIINNRYHGKKRRIMRRLKAGKYSSAKRLAAWYVMNKKKKGLFGSASQWKWNIYKRIFRKLPVKKNLYLFESFLGKSYGDSCRAIYEYMQREIEAAKNAADNGQLPAWLSEKPRFVWIIDNKDARIPGRHKEAKPLSLKYFYYVARCGAWVNNMRQPAWYEKREGVRFLETWHGTPLKKLVFDMEDVHSASPTYKMTFYRQSRIWDWLISDNRFSTEAFKSAFLFPEERILELGYPRNDLLYGDDRDERAAAVKRRLGVPGDKKIVLYAPTWRDDDYYGPGQYKFELPLDLKLMEKLKDRYFFILRTHYFIADHLQLDDSQKSFVMDCSRYNDIGELYLISDVLITDYSSVFFDFANLRRPILFYVYDFEKYRDTLRGFYFDMETGCPGPLLYTSEEVAEALEDIEEVEKKYSDKYREFTGKFCSLDDGHAAERIVKKVFG